MWQVFKVRLALIMVFGTLTLGFLMIFVLNPSVSRNDDFYFNASPPPLYTYTPQAIPYPPRAIMTMTELGQNLTRTQNALREQTLGATLTATPIMPTATPSQTGISPAFLTATAIVGEATTRIQTMTATYAVQATSVIQTQTAQAGIDLTQTQAVQNATEGTLSLIVTPEATP